MDALETILKRLDSAEQDIKTLNRGLYGDDKNEVSGLIQTVRDIKEIVKKIQDGRKTDKLKVVYFGMGAGTIIGGLFWLIEHFLIK